mmetsp:Transcript_6565/g.7509  ORF Transcript_6565/g.7509 Transcript_6565/m.7509 type:complete len:133 (-) Transcript_6565:1462-1860(-)
MTNKRPRLYSEVSTVESSFSQYEMKRNKKAPTVVSLHSKRSISYTDSVGSKEFVQSENKKRKLAQLSSSIWLFSQLRLQLPVLPVHKRVLQLREENYPRSSVELEDACTGEFLPHSAMVHRESMDFQRQACT